MAHNSTDSSALCTSLSFCVDDVGKNALFSCLFASNRWNGIPYLTSNAKLCIIIIRQRCIDVNASLRIQPPVYRRQCMAARPVYLEGHATDIKNDISLSVLNFLTRFSIRNTSGESSHFNVNNVLEFNDHHTSISLRSRGIKTQFYHASCATTNLTRIE